VWEGMRSGMGIRGDHFTFVTNLGMRRAHGYG
jgi:hypothetical protein